MKTIAYEPGPNRVDRRWRERSYRIAKAAAACVGVGAILYRILLHWKEQALQEQLLELERKKQLRFDGG